MLTSKATRAATAIAAKMAASSVGDRRRRLGSAISLSCVQVPHVAVTADARQLASGRVLRIDGLDDGRVAIAARRLGNPEIGRNDPDRLGEPPGGEREGVPEPVLSLDEPLGEERVRGV